MVQNVGAGGMMPNQMPGNQMNQMNTVVGGMIGNSQNQQLNQNSQQQQQQQMQNQSGPGSLQVLQGVSRSGPMPPVNVNVGQMNQSNAMMNIQQSMARKQQQDMNMMGQGNAFNPAGVRSVTPNSFLSQSPSPSVPSPHQNISMVPSPAMVPSPSPQVVGGQQPPPRVSNVMAPSPSASINTPGQAQVIQMKFQLTVIYILKLQAVPSPLNLQDDQIYREKYRQLTKYIEPLKRMIARMGSDGKLF